MKNAFKISILVLFLGAAVSAPAQNKVSSAVGSAVAAAFKDQIARNQFKSYQANCFRKDAGKGRLMDFEGEFDSWVVDGENGKQYERRAVLVSLPGNRTTNACEQRTFKNGKLVSSVVDREDGLKIITTIENGMVKVAYTKGKMKMEQYYPEGAPENDRVFKVRLNGNWVSMNPKLSEADQSAFLSGDQNYFASKYDVSGSSSGAPTDASQ